VGELPALAGGGVRRCRAGGRLRLQQPAAILYLRVRVRACVRARVRVSLRAYVCAYVYVYVYVCVCMGGWRERERERERETERETERRGGGRGGHNGVKTTDQLRGDSDRQASRPLSLSLYSLPVSFSPSLPLSLSPSLPLPLSLSPSSLIKVHLRGDSDEQPVQAPQLPLVRPPPAPRRPRMPAHQSLTIYMYI
jgi:hypothetical protein